MNSTLKTSAIALAMGLSSVGAYAAATASDTAANYSGSGFSTSAPNSGSGFAPWSFADDNLSPPYTGAYLDETSYGNSDGALSGGYAWGLYANSGPPTPYVDMTRGFLAGASGSSSLYNQTFSMLVGSAGIGNAGSSMGVSIGSAFNVSYIGGGSDNMVLSVDGGAASTLPIAFANLNAGLQLSLAVSGPLNSLTEGYTLTLSPAAGGPALFVGTGTFDSLDYNTSSVTVADVNTSNDQFANNLNITAEAVPEPSTLALIAVNGAAAVAWFRRRK